MMSNDRKVTEIENSPVTEVRPEEHAWYPDDSALAAPPAATPAAISDQLPSDRYLNRELSWLDFNARVLALAADKSMPLLERAKFLAIFASNLDEFYMVRVAGLKRRDEMGLSVRSADGLTPREQLGRIGEQTQQLASRHARVFSIRCYLRSARKASTSSPGPIWIRLSATDCRPISTNRSSPS